MRRWAPSEVLGTSRMPVSAFRWHPKTGQAMRRWAGAPGFAGVVLSSGCVRMSVRRTGERRSRGGGCGRAFAADPYGAQRRLPLLS